MSFHDARLSQSVKMGLNVARRPTNKKTMAALVAATAAKDTPLSSIIESAIAAESAMLL